MEFMTSTVDGSAVTHYLISDDGMRLINEFARNFAFYIGVMTFLVVLLVVLKSIENK